MQAEHLYDLDLTRCAFERKHGPLTVFGTWFGRRRKPALVLLRTDWVGKPGVTPCVVPLKTAWEWSEEIGDPRHAARVSAYFAPLLGLSDDMQSAMLVTAAVRNHLGDLLAMPPTPVAKVVVADAVLTDESGRKRHAEIVDHG